ncbi:hypothetical protein MASR2M48_09220 [Spirochaetota bacterium]
MREAIAKDGWSAKDDITCGVAYWRHPRRLLVLTGTPVSKDKDKEMTRLFTIFEGRKVISGGTTANIIARETGGKITVDIRQLDPEIPPCSELSGADLVTEGILTLARLASLLESDQTDTPIQKNAAGRLLEMMLDSDVIHFLVGTRINDTIRIQPCPLSLRFVEMS